MNKQATNRILARIANKCTSELIEWNNEVVFAIRRGDDSPRTESIKQLIQDELLSRGI